MPVILERHKIAFFNIPKAASTSVKDAFYFIEHGKSFQPGDFGASFIHQLYKVKIPVTKEDYEPLSGYWKFTVLRDPAKRILSAYTNRVLHHRDMHKMPRARLRALASGLPLNPSLDIFLANLERYRDFSHSIRSHTDPISMYVGPDMTRLDAIYRIDELPRLAEDLTKRTGIFVEMPHLQTGGPKIDVHSLSKKSYDTLMAYTADEYTMLRGVYEPPSWKGGGRVTKTASVSLQTVSDAAKIQMLEITAKGLRRANVIRGGLQERLGDIAQTAVAHGAPPAWFGYRRVEHETVQEYFLRRHDNGQNQQYETVHPVAEARNQLPCNVSSREDLPDDRGWWGYSFRDVPQRISSETFIATIPDCLITWYRDPEKSDDFYPAILNRDGRALDMREVRFRPLHALTLRQSQQPVRLKKATWFIERVYHNHSHWLTAHLPKLLLLRERGMLGNVLLPPERTTAMDGSLRMLGLEPEQFKTFDPARPLFIEELTIMGTDRFRPELLQMIPGAFGVTAEAAPHKKTFISRLKAARRRLVNEDEVWSLLEPLGFERVIMEEMTFEAQVQLMRETAVLVAPHGAGLTNMVFCPRGAHIVEIADLSFPNPNFYAVASAMGHNYWLIPAESIGDVHPLEKDLRVDPAAVRQILPALIPPSEAKTK